MRPGNGCPGRRALATDSPDRQLLRVFGTGTALEPGVSSSPRRRGIAPWGRWGVVWESGRDNVSVVFRRATHSAQVMRRVAWLGRTGSLANASPRKARQGGAGPIHTTSFRCHSQVSLPSPHAPGRTLFLLGAHLQWSNVVVDAPRRIPRTHTPSTVPVYLADGYCVRVIHCSLFCRADLEAASVAYVGSKRIALTESPVRLSQRGQESER